MRNNKQGIRLAKVQAIIDNSKFKDDITIEYGKVWYWNGWYVTNNNKEYCFKFELATVKRTNNTMSFVDAMTCTPKQFNEILDLLKFILEAGEKYGLVAAWEYIMSNENNIEGMKHNFRIRGSFC